MEGRDKSQQDRAWDRLVRQVRTVFELLKRALPPEHHDALDHGRTLIEDSLFDARRAEQSRAE